MYCYAQPPGGKGKGHGNGHGHGNGNTAPIDSGILFLLIISIGYILIKRVTFSIKNRIITNQLKSKL
jgi:hypothetical protein